MDEIVVAVRAVGRFTEVFGWPPDTLTPPAAYLSYPESVDFDETYGRGDDQITDLPIVLVTGKVVERESRDQVARWASGDGVQSLKATLESYRWTSCDRLVVTRCRFDVETIAGIPYLAAVFSATIVGEGKDQ